MAKDDKLEEEAKLFLYFVYKIKNLPVEQCENIFESDGIQYIKIKKEDKILYQCIYCGTSYVYKKGLSSHMKRLHNIS
ncbi:hypothetical protein A0H76_2154 [Hepatospora eriocheir]|uniref:C2H2-type domain-containing protein n=1 Tax=Hepatospora eriocheir TaxID=1081669 RepID=A0A1X0QK44_9MICR|nr:hypothetical protein A0H76_2154 [Hepatospora eriocheir]